MITGEIANTLSIDLLNVARQRITESVSHTDIISPFSRMYLIKQGKGSLQIGETTIQLTPGNIYLIPSYTVCTYTFSKNIDQYYIHFKTGAERGVNIYDFFTNTNKVQAEKYHEVLFKKLIQMHPNQSLPTAKPDIYQNKEWLNKKTQYSGVTELLETKAIIELLLARFLTNSNNKTQICTRDKHRIKKILVYIQKNIETQLEIKKLSAILCVTPDHFAKIFRNATGYTPVEYINRKRIERAQSLLLTTDKSIKEIIEKVGFRSIGYFSKRFKAITEYTPSQYRKLH